VEEKEPDAIEIQGKNSKSKRRTSNADQSKARARAREETNQVAFGEGGPVSGPYGSFAAGGAKADSA